MKRQRRFPLFLLGSLVILATMILANPYPRQLLFGPRYQDVPLCVYQESIRSSFAEGRRTSTWDKIWGWFRGGGDLQVPNLSSEDRQAVGLTLVDDPNPRVRAVAADSMRHCDKAEIANVLVHLLGDADRHVRQAAAEAIASRGRSAAEQLLPGLGRLLDHAEPAVRESALEALTRIHPRPAELAVLLERALRDPVPLVRTQAALQLATYGNRKRQARAAVPQLEKNLQDADVLSRVSAALAYWTATRKAELALPVARAALAHPDLAVRRQALDTLDRMEKAGLAAWDDVVRLALTETDRVTRYMAIRCLAHGGEKAVPVLLSVWSTHTGDEIHPLRALQRIGPPAKEAAEVLLKDPKWVSSDVILTVGRLQAFDQMPDLTVYLESGDPMVQNAAIEALGHFGSAASFAVPKLLEFLTDPPQHTREVARTLGKVGADSEKVLPALLKLLASPIEDEYTAACDGLTELGPKGRAAIPKLLERLQNGKPEFAYVLADIAAFGDIGAAAAGPAVDALLLPLNTKIHPSWRAGNARSLGTLRHDPARVVPTLSALLKFDDESVRLAAAEALARFGSAATEAVPLLQSLVDDERDDAVSEAAAKTIETIGKEPLR